MSGNQGNEIESNEWVNDFVGTSGMGNQMGVDGWRKKEMKNEMVWKYRCRKLVKRIGNVWKMQGKNGITWK